MAHRTTLDLSLTPDLDQFVTSRVASGRYRSALEVVRAGLRLLAEQELAHQDELSDLQEKIAVGLDQARRGELLDGNAVFDELEERIRRPHQTG